MSIKTIGSFEYFMFGVLVGVLIIMALVLIFVYPNFRTEGSIIIGTTSGHEVVFENCSYKFHIDGRIHVRTWPDGREAYFNWSEVEFVTLRTFNKLK